MFNGHRPSPQHPLNLPINICPHYRLFSRARKRDIHLSIEYPPSWGPPAPPPIQTCSTQHSSKHRNTQLCEQRIRKKKKKKKKKKKRKTKNKKKKKKKKKKKAQAQKTVQTVAGYTQNSNQQNPATVGRYDNMTWHEQTALIYISKAGHLHGCEMR